jgi:Bacterial Ig-like domain (group 3)/Lamin Tail Domain/Divergent InlB B-repeat domain
MRPPTRRHLSVCPKPVTRYFLILSVPLFALALALVHGFAAAPAPKAPTASAPNGASAATANGSGFERASGASALNAAAGISAALAAPLAPSAFTSGDLVVYRVGTGSGSLAAGATAVFLDEYSPAGTSVQSIALPTAASGSNRALTASGTATSEGELTLSTDGRYLTAAGYDAAPGTSVTSSSSATVNRVIARVDAAGGVDTTTALNDASTGSNPRGAVSTDGTNIWMDGGAGGLRFTTFGSTTSTQINTAGTVTANLRQTNIFNGQLYVSSASGTLRLGAVGTGTPTTSGQTVTQLPGVPTNLTSPYGFFFAHLNGAGTAVDTLYITDDSTSSGGLLKYSLVGGTWVSNGSVGTSLGVHSVTGSVQGGTVTLYVVSSSTLYKLTDTSGYNATNNGTLTNIAAASANTAFRGVAFAPSGSGTPNFALNVSRAGTGTGTVTSSPAGINCGATCSANYASATAVTLTANANAGSTFTSWTGCDSTSGNTCNVSMNSNRTVTATFTSAQRTLTVNRTGTGTGTVTSSPAGINCGATCSATYNDGTPVTLTAAADVNSTFAGWTGCDSTSGNTCNVTLGADRAVTATFNTTQRVLSVSRTGTGTGTVTSSPAGISCGATCSANYTDGAVVTLTASPDATAAFAGWSGDCTGTGPCTVTMNANKSVTATFNFVPPPTSVKISQVYGGGGNSGSTYTNDFIELYNQGPNPVALDGWSVQATSAAGTSWTANGAPTLLSGTIQPGHYYLVQESQGGGGTTSLPTADANGVITMSGTNAKVALVASTNTLTGPCPLGGAVVDFVGYGSANCSEGGAATPALTNTTAAVRRGNGCTDTDNNANDFVVIGPIPRNSASPVNSCGGDATQPSGLGLASPSTLDPASNTLLTVRVTPATTPPSTDISVNANLTSIGGSATQQFYDDGTNGDATAGDNVFSFQATVAPNITTGAKSIVATITDAQTRTATAPITLTIQSPTCGVERWSVKVGTDSDANLVNINNPVHTTIGQLRSLTPPADPPGPPDNSRIQPTEATVYVVDATMTLYKKETDVDYHIVIQDDSGQTMIAEIPSPACVLTPTSPRQLVTGPFSSGIAGAREKFDARFTATPNFQTANVPVRVKGVAFFDFIHGQTGVAPNGIELHPLLDIEFTANTMTTLLSSSNPSQYNQQVSVTATVSNNGAAATPTGNVTFFDGGNAIDVEPLDQNGQATFTSHTLSVGSHSITASYEGDDASAPSTTSAALVQVVNKADQTIDFAPLAAKTYGDPDFALSATASSGLPVSFAILSGPATISGNTVHITGAGTVTVRASQDGDSNYNAAPNNDRSFEVARADQTINFAPLADKTYGDAPFTVSATGGASTSPVTFSASGNCTSGGMNGATITINGAGSCTVTASQAGDSNYNAAPAVPRSFTVNQAAANIVVNGYAGVYDGQAHGATGAATGVGGEDLSALLSFGSAFTDVPGGTAQWTFAGNNNYMPASGTAAINIAQAQAAVTINDYTGVYDGSSHGASGSAAGVNGEDLSALLNLGATFTDVPGGTAHWSFAGNTNYSAASGTANVVITQATAAVSIQGYSGVYDGNAHGATGSATGVKGESLNNLLHLGDSFTNVPGGTAHWSFDGDANYSATNGTAAIVITKANADISIVAYSVGYDGQPHTATGTARGVESPNPADLSGLLGLSGTTHTNANSYPNDSWSFAGNNNYNAASGTVSDQIAKASSTTAVTCATGPFTYNGSAITPCTAAVTGVGGLSSPVSVSYSNNVNAGTATASASYAGDSNHEASGDSKNFTINKATPSFSNLSSPAIAFGTSATTLSGKLGLGALVPTGSVSITLNGVTQNAAIQAGGNFSSTFATASLPPTNPPYTIAYSYGGDTNFNPASGAGTLTVGYGVVALYDQTKAANSGSTIPVKVEITNADGTNVSSADMVLTAVGVGPASTNTYGPVANAGNANPNNIFRFTGDSYIFNLKTTGLAAGVYKLYFRVGSDPTLHTVQFQVR